MAFVNVAIWKAAPGNSDRVREILSEMVTCARAEPGCLAYLVHESVEEHGLFLIYEQFRDRAAFDLHSASQDFRRLVLEDATPLLESRRRTLLTLIF